MSKVTSKDIIPILFLTIVVCISAIALTITNSITEDRIQEQKDEKIKEMLAELFEDLDDFEYATTMKFTLYMKTMQLLAMHSLQKDPDMVGLSKYLLGFEILRH